MVTARTIHLYKISLLSAWHRLQHDLARELVVAVCAAVILATFGYMFNDFLNVKIEELSPPMRNAFAKAAAIFLLMLATIVAARLIRFERFSPGSLREIALRLGEERSKVTCFIWLRALTILVLVYGVTWWIIQRFLISWPLSLCVPVQGLLVLLVVATQWLPGPRSPADRTVTNLIPPNWTGSQLSTLVRWRFVQMARRNRLTQMCLGLGFFINGLALVVGAADAPTVAVVFVVLVGGLFGSMALAFQLQEDLSNAWAERCLGVSHDIFERTYHVLGVMFGALIGALPTIGMIFHDPSIEGLSLAGKVLIISWIPFFAMPSLMFQIDGHRPGIQAVLVTIVSLILATAILASWFALVILPVYHFYLSGVQNGRFYRA